MPGSVPNPPAASSSPSRAAPATQTRCVLLNRPNAAVPSDLLNSLAKRIGHIVSCTDAFGAMAEVCTIERDRAAALGGNAAAGSGTVLLLIEPQTLPDSAELVSQVRMFAPGAVCWKFEAGANPKLAAVVDRDVADWTAAQTVGQLPATTRGQTAATGSIARSDVSGNAHTQQRHTSSPLPQPDPSPLGAPAPSPRRAAPNQTPPLVAPAAAASPKLRLAGASLPDPSGPIPEQPEIVVRPQPKQGRSMPPSAPPPSSPPNLTLRGRMQAEDAGAPQRVRPVLSAEELRMLLGDDPIDHVDHGPTNGTASKGGGGGE